MKNAVPWLLCLFLSACSQATVTSSGGLVPGKQLVPEAKVLIVKVTDARQSTGDVVGGSGLQTGTELRDTLLAHGIQPFVSDHDTLAPAFAEAVELGFKYVLRPQLPEWEDNATEWSARPDSVTLALELYDASSKEMVATGTHRIVAPSFAFGPETPDRFLPELADVALSRIFGWQPKQWEEFRGTRPPG